MLYVYIILVNILIIFIVWNRDVVSLVILGLK